MIKYLLSTTTSFLILSWAKVPCWRFPTAVRDVRALLELHTAEHIGQFRFICICDNHQNLQLHELGPRREGGGSEVTFTMILWFGRIPLYTLSLLASVLSTAEAMHIGSLIAAQGYFFPISDHVLTLKDDGTFYRFQVSRWLEGRHFCCIQTFHFMSCQDYMFCGWLTWQEFWFGGWNWSVLYCVLNTVLGLWDPIKNEWWSVEIFIKLTREADLHLVGIGWWAEAWHSVVKRPLESSRDKQADILPTCRPQRWDGGD